MGYRDELSSLKTQIRQNLSSVEVSLDLLVRKAGLFSVWSKFRNTASGVWRYLTNKVS